MIEIFLVSFLLFVLVSGGLALTQWWRKAPMPVGCTPVNGQCCRSPDGQCSATSDSAGASGGYRGPMSLGEGSDAGA